MYTRADHVTYDLPTQLCDREDWPDLLAECRRRWPRVADDAWAYAGKMSGTIVRRHVAPEELLEIARLKDAPRVVRTEDDVERELAEERRIEQLRREVEELRRARLGR